MQSFSASLQHLGRVLLASDGAGLSDAELVRQFAERRDEAAFTALVRRYGTVVFGVCRRVLRHEQDAEDAFQATFLVLARNAGNVQRAAAVGNWLYGVACNVARKARAMRQRRELKEREAAARLRKDTHAAAPDDLKEILDHELQALPDKYRAAIVLCDLRGLTIREAAGEVGCPAKTLATRLSRGRSLLASRLGRRGVLFSAGALTAALGPSASAAAPARLVHATVHAAIQVAAGSAATVSPAVAALTQGVSNVMLLKPLKYVAVLAFCVLVLTGLAMAHWPASPARPVVLAANAAAVPAVQAPATDAQSGQRHVGHDRLLEHIHHVLCMFAYHLTQAHAWLDEGESCADKDKPALSGVWVKKAGELKLDLTDKDVMKISPHGDNAVIIISCKYTVDKDGLVKATVSGLEGKEEAIKMVKEKLPVGFEFSFKWQAKDNAATLVDVKGENVDVLKSHLEGDFEQKK